MTRLSRAAQIDGQRKFIAACYVNPLGAGFTIGPLISLLALSYGAGDLVLGLLFAAPFLGTLPAVFGPSLLAGRDTSRLMAGAWLWRSFVGLGYFAILLLSEPEHKLLVLVATCYGFMTLRSFGIIAFHPIVKALNRPRELPSFANQTQACWQTGTLITTIVSYLVLNQAGRFPSQEWAYLTLILLGFVFNLVTALLYRRLPPTGVLDGGNLHSMAVAARTVLRTPAYREVVVICLLQIFITVAAGYQLAYLKQVLLLEDATVFALTIAGVLSAIACSRIAKLVSLSLSRRAMLFSSHCALLVCALGWLLIGRFGPGTHLLLAACLFVISTGMLAVKQAIMGGLMAERLPDRHRVQVAIVYQLCNVAAAAAGIALVSLGGHFRSQLFGPGVGYQHAFLLWGGASVLLCLLAARMRGGRPIPLLRELTQLSPSNVTTMVHLNRLDQSAGNGDDLQIMRELENLMSNHTPAGTARMLEMLGSPEVRHRLFAMRSLPDEPIPEALPLLEAEAANPDSPLRSQAITNLGLMGSMGSLPLLRNLLDDSRQGVVCAARKSLMRLGDPYGSTDILEHFAACDEPPARLDLVIGLMAVGDIATLWHILARELPRRPHVDWQCALFLAIATAGGCRQRLGELLASERQHPGEGLEECMLDLEDTHLAEASVVVEALRAHAYEALPRLCRVPDDCRPESHACAIGLVYCAIVQGQICGPPASLLTALDEA